VFTIRVVATHAPHLEAAAIALPWLLVNLPLWWSRILQPKAPKRESRTARQDPPSVLHQVCGGRRADHDPGARERHPRRAEPIKRA